MKLQLFQLHIKNGDVESNEALISYYFENHLNTDTDIVILPEMWNNGYALAELQSKADHDLKRSLPFIQQLAQHYNVTIVAGSVSNIENNKLYNTAFSVDAKGHLINKYHKIHLVPMLDEPKYLDAGEEVPESFTINDNIFATQVICYDLRFPEISRYPATQGAQILFYVAQWPEARRNHWRTLLQARAIENNAFVVACNGCGSEEGTVYAGHSMVVNPNGEIIIEASESEEVLTTDIEIEEVTKQRQAIPVFDNIRPHLYK